MDRARTVLCTTLVALVAAGCVGPARTYAAYEADAYATATEALSGVETARLATEAAEAGDATQNFLSIVLGDAEDQATGAQERFDSVQPPGRSADALKAELDKLLDRAATVLTDLRINVRRGEIDRLAAIARPLKQLSKDLDAFAKEHES